jgi:hypothetical protein
MMMLNMIHPPANVVMNLFSRTIFKICLLIESSSSGVVMDRFIKKRQSKIINRFTDIGRCVCVLGKTGIGKSWAVREAFGGNFIELTADILRGKQSTIDFLERLESTDTPVVLDEFETMCDLVGIREITGAPSKGQFIVVSQIPVNSKFEFEIVTYDFPVPTFEQLKKIAPDATDEVIHKSKGDIRQVLKSLRMKSDDQDAFMTTREFVTSLVAKGSTKRPFDYLSHHVQEPGNMVSILQENYLDARGADLARIAHFMSTAEIFETKLYEGDWQLLPYYTMYGCILPAVEIGHRLNPAKMRPGSSWTKHQNMCMREKRIKSITDRVPFYHLDTDTLILLRDMAEAGQYDILREYKLEPKDIDVLNHLSPLRKLKPKTVQALKKALTQ